MDLSLLLPCPAKKEKQVGHLRQGYPTCRMNDSFALACLCGSEEVVLKCTAKGHEWRVLSWKERVPAAVDWLARAVRQCCGTSVGGAAARMWARAGPSGQTRACPACAWAWGPVAGSREGGTVGAPLARAGADLQLHIQFLSVIARVLFHSCGQYCPRGLHINHAQSSL